MFGGIMPVFEVRSRSDISGNTSAQNEEGITTEKRISRQFLPTLDRFEQKGVAPPFAKTEKR